MVNTSFTAFISILVQIQSTYEKWSKPVGHFVLCKLGGKESNIQLANFDFLIQRLKIHDKHLIYSFYIHLSANTFKLTENSRKLVGHFVLCKLGGEEIEIQPDNIDFLIQRLK